MNWFRIHLNWTWLLGYLVALGITFIVGFTMGVDAPGISRGAAGMYSLGWSLVGLSAVGFVMGAADTPPTGGIAGWLVGSIIILVVSGWFIKQKGRSLWWLLLAGCFLIPLLMVNKKVTKESSPPEP